MKKFKKIIALVLTICTFASLSSFGADAANSKTIDIPTSKTKYQKKGSCYMVYSVSTSNYATYSKKLNIPGFRKTKYTGGNFIVSRTQSVTLSSNVTLKSEFSTPLWRVGADVSIGASETSTAYEGVTVQLKDNAPDGIYYAYLCVPHRKATFSVRSCSLNHTSWNDLYKKSGVTAPMIDMSYVELRRLNA